MNIVMSQLSITSCQHLCRQCLKWSHMNHKHVILQLVYAVKIGWKACVSQHFFFINRSKIVTCPLKCMDESASKSKVEISLQK